MSDGKKFRFSDRISFVTEYGGSVFIDDKALVEEAAKTEEQNRKSLQEQSYQQGWAACAAAKDREIEKLRQSLSEWKQELPAALNEYFTELEHQLKEESIDLSFQLAETIIGGEVSRRTDWQGVLDEIFAQSGGIMRGELYVNPEVAAAIEVGKTRIGSGVKVVPDPALRVGEAKIVGNMGIVDGTFSARLVALREYVGKQIAAQPDESENQGAL